MHWPLSALPQILYGGLFPIDDRHFAFTHCLAQHALHFYGYSAKMRLGGVELDIQRGDITFTPAGTPAQYDLPSSGHHWCVRFTLPQGRTDEPAVELPLHLSMHAHYDVLADRFAQLSAIWSEGLHNSIAAAAGAAGLQELILHIVMFSSATKGDRHRRNYAINVAERAANLIKNRFAEPLTIPQISREIGVGQNYLARQFRQRFGVTMPHFIIGCRVENARLLLASTELSITTIGTKVGMPDSRHFFKQFCRLTGKGPSAFRDATRGVEVDSH